MSMVEAGRMFLTGRLHQVLSFFSAALLSLSLLGGCTTNPATGKTSLVALSSAQDDARIGAEAHPQIIAAYGGVYDDPRIGDYVTRVTQRVVHGTSQPNQPYRVTVLNSPIVNAFALPGGYVYVTRGLLALVNDEAELAGVLGHEIGHVIARHSARRQTAAFGASLIGAVLGAVTGSSAVNQAAGLGGQGLIAGYSRDQEYEADMLGVRYLAAAGYDPYAQSDFLKTMGENSQIEAQIAGQSERVQTDWLNDHPATLERVTAARREATTNKREGDQYRGRNVYLNAINGMVFGESADHGFIRGRNFIHTQARFRFEAPSGFQIVNNANEVMVLGPDKTIAKFSMANKSTNIPIDVYLERVWAANVAISPVQRFTIRGLSAASATTRIGDYDARLVAIAGPNGKAYRFLMGAQRGTYPRYVRDFDELVFSFRLISAKEAHAIKPLRIHIVTVMQGDSVASLAADMSFSDHRAQRFRALNGLDSDTVLVPGEKVKIVRP